MKTIKLSDDTQLELNGDGSAYITGMGRLEVGEVRCLFYALEENNGLFLKGPDKLRNEPVTAAYENLIASKDWVASWQKNQPAPVEPPASVRGLHWCKFDGVAKATGMPSPASQEARGGVFNPNGVS